MGILFSAMIFKEIICNMFGKYLSDRNFFLKYGRIR